MGLDLGGVITRQGEGHLLVEGAEAGVACLVRELGPDQVHLISRVNSAEGSARRLQQLQRADFFKTTGLDPANVHWVTSYDGRDSKGLCPSQSEVLRASSSAPHLPVLRSKPSDCPGPVALRLRLTHFVDDQVRNLRSVEAVVGCECLLFIRNGEDQRNPSITSSLWAHHYATVPDWKHLVQILLHP